MLPSNRLLVMGLDGATMDMLGPLMDDGRMPFLQSLFRRGSGGKLRTVYPPVTAPAWASFMTGKNPGKHGVFEFRYRRRGAMRQMAVSSRSVSSATLWQLMSRAGKRVAALNVPLTYPPEPINGLMIGGFLTPSGAQDFTYPSELRAELESRYGPYPLHHKQVYTPTNTQNVLDELYHHQTYVSDVAEELLRREPWDFFMVHFAGTDRLQHELWHILDAGHPMHRAEESARYAERTRDFYTLVDRDMERLARAAGDDTTVVALSDHGFGGIHHFVNFNVWLLQEGFLTLKRDALTAAKRILFDLGITPSLGYRVGMQLGLANLRLSQGMKDRFTMLDRLEKIFLSLHNVDWPRTQAYAQGNYGQIYVNLKGREEFGSVEPGEEYESVCRRLMERLAALRDPRTGQRVVEHIFHTRALYSGAFLECAPDVVFLLTDTYKALGTLDFSSNRLIEPTFGNSGDHRMDGFAVLCGPPIAAEHALAGARIIDMGPTLLHLAGLPAPMDMDGVALTQALTPAYLAAYPPALAAAEVFVDQRETAYTDAEEAEIAGRLRQLGYLG